MAFENEYQSFLLRLNRSVEEMRSPEIMRAAGEKMADIVKVRTRLGYGVGQNLGTKAKLKALSEKYIKYRKDHSKDLYSETRSGKSNLTFTGEMLNSIKVVDAKVGGVSITPTGMRADKKDNEDLAKWNTKRGRPFLYISSSEVKQLRIWFAEKHFDLLKSGQLL